MENILSYEEFLSESIQDKFYSNRVKHYTNKLIKTEKKYCRLITKDGTKRYICSSKGTKKIEKLNKKFGKYSKLDAYGKDYWK